MQQSSATPPYILVFGGCGRLLHALNPPSCIYSFWHGVIPTSYFIFYTCTQSAPQVKQSAPVWWFIRWPRRAFRVLLLSCDFSRSRDTLFYISQIAYRVWHFPFCVSQIAFRILCFFRVSHFAFRVWHTALISPVLRQARSVH